MKQLAHATLFKPINYECSKHLPVASSGLQSVKLICQLAFVTTQPRSHAYFLVSLSSSVGHYDEF